jgi:hypothetical protein
VTLQRSAVVSTASQRVSGRHTCCTHSFWSDSRPITGLTACGSDDRPLRTAVMPTGPRPRALPDPGAGQMCSQRQHLSYQVVHARLALEAAAYLLIMQARAPSAARLIMIQSTRPSPVYVEPIPVNILRILLRILVCTVGRRRADPSNSLVGSPPNMKERSQPEL